MSRWYVDGILTTWQAQAELLHEKAGQYGVMVRRSFPPFDSVPGLRMALSLKIKVGIMKELLWGSVLCLVMVMVW